MNGVKEKARILIVATFPPPVHGSAVISQYIRDSKVINENFDCDYVNISLSKDVDLIGEWSFYKIGRYAIALLQLLSHLFRHRYDLCYLAITCHGIGFLKDAPFVLLCKVFGNKIVIHQHNKGMSKDVERWPYRWLLPLCYKEAKVILLSWRLYPDIERIVARENVCICPNGIQEVEYVFKERNNDVIHLLFLSNLIASKGVLVLLDALKILKDNGYSLICDFVGGETKEIDRGQFEDEVNKRGLDNMVYYRGPKYGKGKTKYLSNADIFIFPTFYEKECFPLVLLEAMQYGLPVVTTDEGGIPDMVEDGASGLICKVNNVEILATYLSNLIISKDKRLAMGKKGYELYKNNYTLEVFSSKLNEILKNACNG